VRAAKAQERRRVIDELANAIRAADGLATHLRRQSQTTADDAVALEAAIGRAVAALKRLQPSSSRRARR
jgi:hypothetical protein